MKMHFFFGLKIIPRPWGSLFFAKRCDLVQGRLFPGLSGRPPVPGWQNSDSRQQSCIFFSFLAPIGTTSIKNVFFGHCQIKGGGGLPELFGTKCIFGLFLHKSFTSCPNCVCICGWLGETIRQILGLLWNNLKTTCRPHGDYNSDYWGSLLRPCGQYMAILSISTGLYR